MSGCQLVLAQPPRGTRPRQHVPHEPANKKPKKRHRIPDTTQQLVTNAFAEYTLHCQKIGVKAFDLGEYFTIGENQSPHATSLAGMHFLFEKLFQASKGGEFKPTVLKTGIAETIEQFPKGTINSSQYPDDMWARVVGDRIRIMLKHLRSLKREPTRMVFAVKEIPMASNKNLQRVLDILVLPSQAPKQNPLSGKSPGDPKEISGNS